MRGLARLAVTENGQERQGTAFISAAFVTGNDMPIGVWRGQKTPVNKVA